MNDYYENEIFSTENFPLLPNDACELVECHFNGIDFTEYNFSRLKFLDCEFTDCNFSNVSLKSASFRDIVFKKSKMMGLNWSATKNLSNISFYECIMDYSVFHALNLKGTIFSDCRMSEVDFFESQLMKSSFKDSFLGGAQFNKANLVESDLRGAKDYYIDVRQTQVSKAKFSLPEALTLLTPLEIIIE